MRLKITFLLLLAIPVTACGLESANVTVVEPDSATESEATTAVSESEATSTRQANADAPDTDSVAAEPTSPRQASSFMPKVNTFTESETPVWGAAFCPTTMPLCIRPYAFVPQGDEQVLQVEMWGTGEFFNAGSDRLSITWRAYTEDDDASGNNCGNTTRRAAHYRAGFGHLSQLCFNLETRPSELEIRVNGVGNSFTLALPVAADNEEMVGEYSYAVNAAPLVMGESFVVGPATITINGLEDNGDHLVLDVAVQAPAGESVLVDSPDWIVVGSVISFHTADALGTRTGWDEAKMRAYETVGGEVEAGTTQTGSVILTKSTADAVLLISYGPSTALEENAAIFLLSGSESNSSSPLAAAAVTTATPIADDTTAVSPPATETPRTLPANTTTLRPLEDKWYVDSDGNAIPDFLEIALGYDPFIDDCAPEMCTADLTGSAETAVQDENVLVILDASGSMAEDMGGQTRMDAAKNALTQYVSALPSTARLGLMVYGHQGDDTEAGKPASCAGIELFAPVGQATAASWPSLLDAFAPNGWTPIAAALSAAEDAFAAADSGVNKVVLVTDGLETCDGDPVAEATRLHLDPRFQLVIDVVGFSITAAGDRAALEAIATAGGGSYVDVQTPGDFQDYVAELFARARARLNYAVCIAQEDVSSSVCVSQQLLGATTEINAQIISLGTEVGTDNSVKTEALQQILEAIDAAEALRLQRQQEWRAEAARLLEEMRALDEAFSEFPTDN